MSLREGRGLLMLNNLPVFVATAAIGRGAMRGIVLVVSPDLDMIGNDDQPFLRSRDALLREFRGGPARGSRDRRDRFFTT